MTTVILALLVIAYIAICLFLLGFILLQSGKGGGLSGLAGASPLGDSFGAAGSEKTLSKWTTYCTIAFFILTLVITFLGAQKQRSSSSLLGNLPANKPQAQQAPQQSPAANVEGAVPVEQNVPQQAPQSEAQPAQAEQSVQPQANTEEQKADVQAAPQGAEQQPEEKSNTDKKTESETK